MNVTKDNKSKPNFIKAHYTFGRHKGDYRFCVRYDFLSVDDMRKFEEEVENYILGRK